MGLSCLTNTLLGEILLIIFSHWLMVLTVLTEFLIFFFFGLFYFHAHERKKGKKERKHSLG